MQPESDLADLILRRWPAGLRLGTTPVDDLLAMLGEPDLRSHGRATQILSYGGVEFDVEDGTVQRINVGKQPGAPLGLSDRFRITALPMSEVLPLLADLSNGSVRWKSIEDHGPITVASAKGLRMEFTNNEFSSVALFSAAPHTHMQQAERLVSEFLQHEGWAVEHQGRGVDIDARRGTDWIAIEVKSSSPSNAGAALPKVRDGLGRLLFALTPGRGSVLAIPDVPQYHRAMERLPEEAWAALRLAVLWMDEKQVRWQFGPGERSEVHR